MGIRDLNHMAERFVSFIGTNRVFALVGKMGVGKTTFISAVCEILGVEDLVNSPTFSIINEYYSDWRGGTTIYHFDFYRIEEIWEAVELGVEEYFESEALCFIEWPEIVESLLPRNTIWVFVKEQKNGIRNIYWSKRL